jgi:hypothetical protein
MAKAENGAASGSAARPAGSAMAEFPRYIADAPLTDRPAVVLIAPFRFFLPQGRELRGKSVRQV